jgi:hypothetical protein
MRRVIEEIWAYFAIGVTALVIVAVLVGGGCGITDRCPPYC